ncbi:minor capsid protein [Paenibacillus sp. IHBB 10380]|uniref:minor capsid protein n=1 Tax=Paenibacillus sp. IHBB 10380 TaxID=1566358 RepID=UPI0009E4D8DA|nr:minor capsid protein [Paenibacillus sp. IHBB 10380]
MKPDYWKKRSEQIARRQFIKADAFEVAQRKEYDRAMKSMQRDIEVFYQRYATNNEVTMAEARKQLTKGELKEFKMTLEEFTEKAKDNVDGKWTQELNNVYYKTRVTRLEALQTQINQQVEILVGSRQQSTEKLLGDVYTDTYYRTLHAVQTGVGMGVPFAAIEQTGLIAVLGAQLDGNNWSQRIWGDRTKLRQELSTKLSQSFIRGDSIDRMVKDMMGRFDVSRSNAERLIQTESAFFAGQATAEGYKESGVVKRYEVLATLDLRTSSICRSMDGKVFLLSEREVNVNYPPFHPRCRTTTVASFDDESVGERIARDPDGSTYNVPADMKYEEWYQKHVVDKYGKDEVETMKKKATNEANDKKEYDKYKRIFGKDLGAKNFVEYQDLKYTNSEKWNTLKGQKQKVLNSKDYRKSFYGMFGDKEVREWYMHHDKNIPNKLNTSKSIKEQAIQAHSLRNKYRTEARSMMSDRVGADTLNETRPNQTFEELIAHKKKKYGLNETDSYTDIIRSSQTVNKQVNKSLGLED